ncbi:MAG: methyltransferase domain-containing protein [Bradymonadales bacterium]|nr:methyltransferase domain-containing protein [Bradymonadales bacterium]
MKLKTFLSVVKNGQLFLIHTLVEAARNFHRISFLGSGLSLGALQLLADGPATFDELSAALHIHSSMQDAFLAWLQLGVAVGELSAKGDTYALRGRLVRAIVDPRYDAVAALVEEITCVHSLAIRESSERLRSGRPFTLADHDSHVIARSSRVVEPLIHEVMERLVPTRGPFRLFEIGCGSAVTLCHLAKRNPELTALGLELQESAAALAAKNVERAQCSDRVSIETGDIRQRSPDEPFDLATLHQNIYYFPVSERTDLLRHVRTFLKPGGKLVVTSLCQGGGTSTQALDLWSAMTRGSGRLPGHEELTAQMKEAGLTAVEAAHLIPGESFWSFVGTS